MSTPENPVVFDLVSRQMRPLGNWHEFISRWQMSETLEEMLGLLHVGMSVPLEKTGYDEPEYHAADRYLFYLAIADGWDDFFLLEGPQDAGEYYFGRDEHGNEQRRSQRELRQIAARKAFAILAGNLFKTPLYAREDYGRFHWAWEKVIVTEKLFFNQRTPHGEGVVASL